MVSAGISSRGVTRIQFYIGTQNTKNYIESLQYFKEDIERLSPDPENTLFYQYDLAPPHKGARKEIKEVFKNVLPEWCPKGADFSPVELLWAHVEKELHRKTYENIHQLKYELQDLWNRIDPKLCKNLVSTFDKRVRVINKLKGRRYRKAIEKKMKSEGYFNDICKDDKTIKKPLKKRNFEIKNYFTKYWNQPKDNLEIVLYNDDFLKKYIIFYTDKLEKKLIKHEKIFKANENRR